MTRTLLGLRKLHLSGNVGQRMVRTLGLATIFQILWVIMTIIHAAAYESLLNFTQSSAPYIVVAALEFLFGSWSMVTIASMLMKEEFSSKGIQALKAKVVIHMDPFTTKEAEVQVLDKSIELSQTSKVQSKSANSADSGASADEITNNNSGGYACSPAGVCAPVNVDIITAQELVQPIWNNWPRSFWELFSYPHPVNEWESRAQSLLIAITAMIVLILGAARPDVYCWWLYAWLVYGYLVRTLCGPRFDPQAWLVVLVVGPLLPMPVYVPGPPKRFAQLFCLTVSSIALICYVTEHKNPSYFLISFLCVLTTLQSIHTVCAGCFVWHLIVLTDFMPPEVNHKSTAEFAIKGDTNSYRSQMWAATRSTRSRQGKSNGSLTEISTSV